MIFLKLPDTYFSQHGIHTVLVSTQIVSEVSKSGINRDLVAEIQAPDLRLGYGLAGRCLNLLS